MAIGDAWDLDYVTKRVYNKKALGVDGETTVYSVQALYSWLMDIFDELAQMDDPVPMSAQTPTAYTMINGWFVDNDSVKYLLSGAITTSGYKQGSAPLNPTGVRILTFVAGGYQGPVLADLGKAVLGTTTTDSGKLLAYNNTLRKWWVRSDALDDDFPQAEVVSVTGGSGATGTTTGASVTGEDLYANIYTLGTIETNPQAQIYVFQAGNRIAEWSSLTNWDRTGHIDVLIKVKEADTEIDGAVITVFARQSGDLYDNFEIDLTAGGRNAVPLSTADDINEDTGEWYLLYKTWASAFVVGEIINGQTSGATAEVGSDTKWNSTGVLKLRDKQGTFQNNENLRSGATVRAVANGTVGDTYGTYSAKAVQLTVGLVCTGGTSTAQRILRGVQDDGATGKYVFQVSTTVTGEARDPYYKAFSSGETITDTGTGSVTSGSVSTTIVSGFSDITIAFVNGTATYGTGVGTFISGERVTFTGGEAILLKSTGGATGTITLGNCTLTTINGLTITGDISGAHVAATQNLQSAHTMDRNFGQQSAYPYDVIIQGGSIYAAGRTLAQVYEYFKFACQAGSVFQMFTVVSAVITILDGQEYIIAYSGYVPAKSAPLGTFAGGKYFGAQGVWIEGMAAGQSYQYTDSNGVIRSPYASIIIQVTSLGNTDKVVVFRTSAGAINKAMYTSGAGNNQNDPDFVVQEDIAIDTPPAGAIRLVDYTDMSEVRHTYTAWDGPTKTFSGLDPVLTKAYVEGTDKAYVPFIDQVAGAGTASKEVLFDAERTVLVRVRMYTPGANQSILPFETPGQVTSAGLSVAAIRTTDGIAT